MVSKRQRVLLEVIQELINNNIRSRVYLFKSLFLLDKEYGLNIGFDFHPYKFGPYSIIIDREINKLIKNNYIRKEGNFYKVNKCGKLSNDSIKQIINKFKSQRQILEYVYENYPFFASRSEKIARKKEQIKKGLFDIGYEKKSIDLFISLLLINNINCLIDVRYNAFSMNFDYTKKKLKKYLNDRGVEYLHLKELGINGSLRKSLESEEDYKLLFKNYKKSLKYKQELLNIVISKSKEEGTAIMCFEKDNKFCHRGVIAKELTRQGIGVTAI